MMKELIGREIQAIYVERGEQRIVFETNIGPLAYETEGDCCSETWFADIMGVDALLDGSVYTVEDVDLPDPDDGRSRQEEDSAYGVRITTDRGVGDIVYRNSSNGYYGGSCSRGRDVSTDWLVRIVSDWQASADVVIDGAVAVVRPALTAPE
jgi:hypothetical protein